MSDERTPTPGSNASRVALLGGLLGVTASATLAGATLGLVPHGLPGCSGHGGCGALVDGPWGRVPGIGVPWSYVGLVWFAVVVSGAIGWSRSPGRPAVWFRVAAYAGALLSIGFAIVMATLGAFCPWCAIAHVGSLAVAAAVAASRRSPLAALPGPTAGLPSAGALAVLVALLLAGLDATRRLRVAESAAQDEAAMARDAGTGRPNATADLLGRGRALGNADGRIRVVVFTDYQCPDCARVEAMAKAVAARPDAAVVVKHFPLCAECNRAMPSSPHPDACRRAALAEAAAALGGTEAFAAAHAALFALQATPDADALAAVASATGIDAARLAEAAGTDAVLSAVRRDIDDALALGVTFTPMVFVNGREWKWYVVGGTLDGVVDRVADLAGAPSAPPGATRKLVEDWMVSPRIDALAAPMSEGRIALGPGDPRDDDVEVRVWLDPRIGGSRDLLASLSALVAAGERVRVRVLQCPASEECNPASGMTGGDARSCLASAAIVAAGTVGGDSGFRGMLDGLLAAGSDIDMTAILRTAAALGLDHSAFQAQFASGEALATARREAETLVTASRLQQIPTLVVDGRVVPRWSHPGADTGEVLRAILAEARRR